MLLLVFGKEFLGSFFVVQRASHAARDFQNGYTPGFVKLGKLENHCFKL